MFNKVEASVEVGVSNLGVASTDIDPIVGVTSLCFTGAALSGKTKGRPPQETVSVVVNNIIRIIAKNPNCRFFIFIPPVKIGRTSPHCATVGL
jgi:hypothetical protein